MAHAAPLCPFVPHFQSLNVKKQYSGFVHFVAFTEKYTRLLGLCSREHRNAVKFAKKLYFPPGKQSRHQRQSPGLTFEVSGHAYASLFIAAAPADSEETSEYHALTRRPICSGRTDLTNV